MIGLLDRRRRLIAMTVAALLALAFLVETASHQPARGRSVPGAATLGLQAGAAPWAPEHTSLARRLAALRLPGQSDTAFHIDTLLRIFIDGRPVPVPAQFGIDPQGRFPPPLHTYDASRIVHIESERAFPFTLGQFLTIWGVRFTDSRLGGYRDRRAHRLHVYVNGRPVAHPAAHVLRAHDRITVGYGPPRSFPTVDRTPLPREL